MSSRPLPVLVAIACWFDLLGYGKMMAEAGFDPSHAKAKKPLARLRAFHRIVAEHSQNTFPTLVMNDGAVAYGSIAPASSKKSWKFIQRSWALYREATRADQRNGGPGLRAVIAVGLRAKGSKRGIDAQSKAFGQIIDQLASGKINAITARKEADKVRRTFDVVPPLQANFAFARAYEAERAGTGAGLDGPNIFLDISVFRKRVPEWIESEPPVVWEPKRVALGTSFIALREIKSVDDSAAQVALRTGTELFERLGWDGCDS